MARPEHKKIYNSTRWQRLRAFKLRMEPLCEYCPPDRQQPATEVDHFKAIADGGQPVDLDNLRSVCRSCHSCKTASFEHIKGCDESGLPKSARHWWNHDEKIS